MRYPILAVCALEAISQEKTGSRTMSALFKTISIHSSSLEKHASFNTVQHLIRAQDQVWPKTYNASQSWWTLMNMSLAIYMQEVNLLSGKNLDTPKMRRVGMVNCQRIKCMVGTVSMTLPKGSPITIPTNNKWWPWSMRGWGVHIKRCQGIPWRWRLVMNVDHGIRFPGSPKIKSLCWWCKGRSYK